MMIWSTTSFSQNEPQNLEVPKEYYEYAQFRVVKDAIKNNLQEIAYGVNQGFRERNPAAEHQWVALTTLSLELLRREYPIEFTAFIDRKMVDPFPTNMMVGTVEATYRDANGTISWRFDTVFEVGQIPQFFHTVREFKDVSP
jgi:hypothetical protein